MNTVDIGVIGLGVMGRNLALNIARRGFSVVVFNRTRKRTEEFAGFSSGRKGVFAVYDLHELISSLSRPRKVLLVVKAGNPTDEILAQLLQLLDPGDLVMDASNAHFADSEARTTRAEQRGIHFVGVGVSGGEFGALHGPSIMAGGSYQGYQIARPVLEAIAAQGPAGTCCAYFGPSSAGHYVKMVHNGIEYAIMQGLAEAYDIMRRGLQMNAEEMANVFDVWNHGELDAYLVGITAAILRRIDPDTGTPLVEAILDTAAQKGTGKWASQSALDIGSPSPAIAAAVFARVVSSLKQERIEAEKVLTGPAPALSIAREVAIPDLFSATYVTTIGAYSQGLRQLRDASAGRGYRLNLAEVARVWMAGCIIRSKLLVPISEAFKARPDLPYLFLAEPFRTIWAEHQSGLRRTLAMARGAGIPVPVISSTADAIDGYRTGCLPANLLQAQRDYFGAHTYRRTDREGFFHTEWEAALTTERGDSWIN